MTSCQLGGSSEARCACVWERVESEIPVAEFEAADVAINSGQPHPLSQQIEAFSNACRAAP